MAVLILNLNSKDRMHGEWIDWNNLFGLAEAASNESRQGRVTSRSRLTNCDPRPRTCSREVIWKEVKTI